MCHKRNRFLSLLLCGALLFSLSAFHIHVEALESSKCPNSSVGHKFVNVVDTDPESVGYHPECPNATVYQLKCEYCGEERGYYGGKHEWSGWTANPDGTQSRSCTLCGAQETGAVPGTSHTHTLVAVTVPATCTRDGYTYQRCTKCDYEGPRTVLPATGHKAVDDDDCRTPPHCAVCGELLWEGKTYPAVHNFSGPYESDGEGHWQRCQNPGCSAVSPKQPHRTTGGVGDCTAGEVCSECGATVAPGRTHNFEHAKVGVTYASGHYLICSNPGCGMTEFFPHSFAGGKCTVCGVADPNYKPAEEPVTPKEPAPQAPQPPQAAPEVKTPQEAPAAKEEPQEGQPAASAQGPQSPAATQEPRAAQGNRPDVSAQFTDVAAGKWYTGNIQRMVDAGLMNGVSADTFGLNTNVDRAMAITILYRMAGQPAADRVIYTDVKSNAYYADAVSWAAQNGIVAGSEDHAFQPKESITRQELATVLYRYAKQAGYAAVSTGNLTVFTDWREIDPGAYEAMAWANQVGLINGRGDNTLAPTATATRAEVAAMMARFMDLLAAR